MSKHRPDKKTYIHEARNIDLTMFELLAAASLCVYNLHISDITVCNIFYWVVIMGAAAEVAISIAKEYSVTTTELCV